MAVHVFLGESYLLINLRGDSSYLHNLGRDGGGPVFMVCGQERLISVCLASKTSWNMEIYHIACWHNMLSEQQGR